MGVLWFLSLGWICLLLSTGMVWSAETEAALPEELVEALDLRYAPYADWRGVVGADDVPPRSGDRYWRTPEEIAASRPSGGLPLSGLRLALDPGHVGGPWAALEGREFRISESDFWIREGELVLIVAELAKERLEALGAEVILLRERNEPVNPKSPTEYVTKALEQVEPPTDGSMAALADYARAIRDRASYLAVVSGDLLARAHRVNREIQPDVLISLHINAAPWPRTEDGGLRLVQSDHAHVLIFGCVTSGELAEPAQLKRLLEKLRNESGAVEMGLGKSLALRLAEAFQLEASNYGGRNAVRPDPEMPYVWARNLMLLRLVDCPTVLLEPFLANSESGYAGLQEALAVRARGEVPEADDVLLRYADAVVAGMRAAYGPAPETER